MREKENRLQRKTQEKERGFKREKEKARERGGGKKRASD